MKELNATSVLSPPIMHPDIERLYKLAAQPQRLVLGLMSGTSLDGLDIALCRFSGSRPGFRLLRFTSIPYDNFFKEQVLAVFSKREISLEQLCLLHPWIARQHAAMVNTVLKEWGIDNKEIDLLASHGQTVFHAPQRLHGNAVFGNATLQIGDGDHLAMATGIITLSDFRQKNIAAGGEGAPLATYGDALLFRSADENRILLNIGGIANFSWLPADVNETLLATDTGPGNTIMDAFIRKTGHGKHFDEDGRMAASGSINEILLSRLKAAPYFKSAFPKTTGPELFNLDFLEEAIRITGLAISAEDIMATLNRFTAETIADAILQVTGNRKEFAVYVSGGGSHNTTLMQHLAACLPGTGIHSFTALGVNPDAKEALLFAVLADACVGGYGNERYPGLPAVAMGKISLPH